MFLNLRLMVAAILVSVVVLSCTFGLFAAFYVSHTPLDRFPAGRAPLQFATDNAASLPSALARGEPGPPSEFTSSRIGVVPTVALAPKPASAAAVEPQQPAAQQTVTTTGPHAAAPPAATAPADAAISASTPAAKSAATPDMSSAATPVSVVAATAIAGPPPTEQAASSASTATRAGPSVVVSAPASGSAPVEPEAAPSAVALPSSQETEIAKPESKAPTYARVRHGRRHSARARARALAQSTHQTFAVPQQNLQTAPNARQHQPLRSQRFVTSPGVGTALAAPRTLGAGGD